MLLNKRLLVFTILAAAFAAVLTHYDLYLLQWVQSDNHAEPAFKVITEIGRSHWYLVPSGLVFFIGLKRVWRHRLWPQATLLFFAVSSSGIVVNILKPLFARARPREFLREEVTGFFHWPQVLTGHLSDYNSFPSGHAATALSAAVAIVFCLPQKYRWLRLPILAMGGVIAASRVMVSAHYASDVIIGALIGIWAVVLCKQYLDNKLSKVN